MSGRAALAREPGPPPHCAADGMGAAQQESYAYEPHLDVALTNHVPRRAAGWPSPHPSVRLGWNTDRPEWFDFALAAAMSVGGELDEIERVRHGPH